MKRPRAPDGAPAHRPRKHRSRPVPKWLVEIEMESIARSRCLMVLSVLSGEKPVTDAVAEAKISRGTYYQLETRALRAMLAVLNPMGKPPAASEAQDLAKARKRIDELEVQIEILRREKRRAERLLLLTRKSATTAPVTTRRGRPPKSVLLNSIRSGRKSSRRSTAKETPIASSIPTKDGASDP